MGGTTPRFALPYPAAADTPDVPRDVKALTDKLDAFLAIDQHGTLAARPAAAVSGRYYTDDASGVTYRDTGSAWKPVNQVATLATLPTTNLVDGQEVSILADATTGVVWRFKYRAASGSAYKWEFVGGPPLVLPGASPNTGTRSPGIAFVLAGPITLPAIGGDFLLEATSTVGVSVAASAFVLISQFARGAGGINFGDSADFDARGAGAASTIVHRLRDLGAPASQIYYWGSQSPTIPAVNTVTFKAIYLTVTPIRCA